MVGEGKWERRSKTVLLAEYSLIIGVGRFRIIGGGGGGGGARFRILGGAKGGAKIPSRHMTS